MCTSSLSVFPQYQLNAESIPVTNGLSMIKGFKW